MIGPQEFLAGKPLRYDAGSYGVVEAMIERGPVLPRLTIRRNGRVITRRFTTDSEAFGMWLNLPAPDAANRRK